MEHSVRRHLRVEIETYDQAIRQFIPGYEEGLTLAAREVARLRPARVLDLGAGTGALAAALLAHDAVGRVEAIDIDPEMLDQARLRLAPFGARAAFVQGAFDALLSPCDAVAASLALHHVPTMERKRAVYGRIRDALRAGGIFVNADVTMPAGDAARKEAFERWAAHLVTHGIGERRAHEHFAEWAAEDTYFPLEDELAALQSAGFRAECPWQCPPFCLMVGRVG